MARVSQRAMYNNDLDGFCLKAKVASACLRHLLTSSHRSHLPTPIDSVKKWSSLWYYINIIVHYSNLILPFFNLIKLNQLISKYVMAPPVFHVVVFVVVPFRVGGDVGFFFFFDICSASTRRRSRSSCKHVNCWFCCSSSRSSSSWWRRWTHGHRREQAQKERQGISSSSSSSRPPPAPARSSLVQKARQEGIIIYYRP